MKRCVIKVIIILSITLIIIICLIIFNSKNNNFKIEKGPFVSTEFSKIMTIPNIIISFGTVKSSNGIEVSSEGSGTVISINFSSGDYVKAGQVLIVLDSGEMKAAVANKASQYHLANLKYSRMKNLYLEHAISKQDLDSSQSELQQTYANLENAKALLGHEIIKAPFSGKIGISEVNIGDYVHQGEEIVFLRGDSSPYIDFSVAETLLKKIYIGEKIYIHLSESNLLFGNIVSIASNINPNNNTVIARAKLDVTQEILLPGAAKVVYIITPADKLVVVPKSAVSYSITGPVIYILKNSKVYLRTVKLGKEINENIVIKNGLKPGEEVVIAGQLKLSTGMRVSVNNLMVN